MAEDDVAETMETIREENFPEVPPELVARIVAIERDYAEHPTEAFKRVGQAIDEYLESRKAGA